MAPDRFLRDYWQKRPLLIRGAFPQFHNCISADDLAGIACEDTALARLVLHDRRRDRWTLRNGPFVAADFAQLPDQNWTLLVQDVDKWDAQVAGLLDAFAFLPAWRIDDIMVSYAVAGGGVGAHVDHYDVFLVQAGGQRRWRIDASRHRDGLSRRGGARAQADREAFREDTELKLLKRFEPTHEWLLEPGDALYLPPGVPHEGTAVADCLTCSVGMRAPSLAELMLDFAETVAEPIDETRRYADPDLEPARDPHEIDSAALERAWHSLAKLQAPEPAALRSWFGKFVTRYRSAHEPVPRAHPLSRRELARELEQAMVVRNPWSRVAWVRSGRGAQLFVAGDSYACPVSIARLLCGVGTIETAAIGRSKAALELLLQLVNAGHFALVPRR